MQFAKDMTASAKYGMEKTKATLQEKGERMMTRDPLQKMATEKKGERIDEAELRKREAQAQHEAQRRNTTGCETTGTGTRTGFGTGSTY